MSYQKKDVHLFDYKDTKLVYDVNSGSLLRTDDLGWELLHLLINSIGEQEQVRGEKQEQQEHEAVISSLERKGYLREEIRAALAQFEDLRMRKLLFSEAPDLSGHDSSASGGQRRVKSLCLFVTQGCNLHCRYCFARKEADKGDGGAKQGGGSHQPMTFEIAKKAVDFLLSAEGPRFREIDFFGGEPLLYFPLIKETVDYAKARSAVLGREASFTVTTNALLLHDHVYSDQNARDDVRENVVDFLNRENINVIISIDGRPQIHDLMRPRVGGGGSYETTLHNAKNFLEKRDFKNYYIRGTYTRENLDFCEDIRHLLNLGFASLSMEPVVAMQKESYALQEEDLPRLAEEYDRLVDLYLEQKQKGEPFVFYHFDMDLEKGPCLYKRISGCGAGTEYLAVSPEGDLYPCHHFVGEKGFCMGNLSGDLASLDQKGIGAEVSGSSKERSECGSCWARYLCGGGCSASSFFVAGDLKKNYQLGCALQKMRLERALYLQAVL